MALRAVLRFEKREPVAERQQQLTVFGINVSFAIFKFVLGGDRVPGQGG